MGDWEISYFSMIVLLYFAFVACLVHPLEMRAEICTLLPSTEGNEGLVELYTVSKPWSYSSVMDPACHSHCCKFTVAKSLS